GVQTCALPISVLHGRGPQVLKGDGRGRRTSVGQTSPGPAGPPNSTSSPKYFRWNQSATFTNPISTGTSTSGPMTAAKAAPCPIPKTAIATAMASSKLLLAAVKLSVAVFE